MKKNSIIQTIILLVLLISVSQVFSAYRDPTRPPNYQMIIGHAAIDSSGGGLSVTAILVKGKNRTAIINGKIYHEGDEVSGAVVKSITPFSVIFLGNKGDFEVSVVDKAKHNIVIKRSR
jgi:hypothetical protein